MAFIWRHYHKIWRYKSLKRLKIGVKELQPDLQGTNELTHCAHMAAWILVIIGYLNGLLFVRCRAITTTNTHLSATGSLGRNFREFWIKTTSFSFQKIHLKMSKNLPKFPSAILCCTRDITVLCPIILTNSHGLLRTSFWSHSWQH